MTYAQQELESEYNGRIDYLREAMAATIEVESQVDGAAEYADDLRNAIVDGIGSLVDRLPLERLERLAEWVERTET
jgi:hypothetical protein